MRVPDAIYRYKPTYIFETVIIFHRANKLGKAKVCQVLWIGHTCYGEGTVVPIPCDPGKRTMHRVPNISNLHCPRRQYGRHEDYIRPCTNPEDHIQCKLVAVRIEVCHQSSVISRHAVHILFELARVSTVFNCVSTISSSN